VKILAAIDLLGGNVARLTKGDPTTAKIYSDDPLAAAKMWERQGASGLHIVDLDAALGLGSNTAVIRRIIESMAIAVQVGVGIRSESYARDLLRWGAFRIVLGTLAFRDEGSLQRLMSEFGEQRVVVALDFSDDSVMTEGWTKGTGVKVEDAVSRFFFLGARRFLMTAIKRDGMLAGPDCEMYSRLSSFPDIELIASGGISSLADLLKLKRAGVKGVVVGKALYDGLLTIEQMISSVAEE